MVTGLRAVFISEALNRTPPCAPRRAAEPPESPRPPSRSSPPPGAPLRGGHEPHRDGTELDVERLISVRSSTSVVRRTHRLSKPAPGRKGLSWSRVQLPHVPSPAVLRNDASEVKTQPCQAGPKVNSPQTEVWAGQCCHPNPVGTAAVGGQRKFCTFLFRVYFFFLLISFFFLFKFSF